MDFKFDVKIDAKNLVARTKKEQKRLAYSVAKASNDTALDIQLAERANLDKKFTLRRAGFMYRLIKIKFASVKQGKSFAEIFIDRSKPRTLLSWFEDGGEKTPVLGKMVGVPITGSPVRPNFSDPVQVRYDFKHLNLQPSGKGKQRKGNKRTFYLPHSKMAPQGGVFMRTGPKTIVQLYEMVHNPKLKERLGFKQIARQVFGERWQGHFASAMERYKNLIK